MCNMPFKDARLQLLKVLSADIDDFKPYKNPVHKESDYPPVLKIPELSEELNEQKIEFSQEFDDRFLRCRGQATRDFYILRFHKFKRLPDLVIWPKSHEEVMKVVELANKYLAIIIPYGGGTNITLSLNYTKHDNKRFFISLDMSQMNRILWIDRVSMLACIEAGIAGKDLENALNAEGLTMGHEPDSLEFSTLGGWVATRSSGMKQQTYGNIEEMVAKISFVTSVGVMEKKYLVPRASLGPDFDQIALGSEGTLGVVTKVVVRVHKKPTERRYGSILFPDFESGSKFMYDVSKLSKKPSNIRLIDNIHYQLGNALQHNKSIIGDFIDFFKKNGASFFLRYNLNKVALATYLIEGEKDETNRVEKNIKTAAWKYWGIGGGSKYGERAYLMTFTVCYIRVRHFFRGLVNFIQKVFKKILKRLKKIKKR